MDGLNHVASAPLGSNCQKTRDRIVAYLRETAKAPTMTAVESNRLHIAADEIEDKWDRRDG